MWFVDHGLYKESLIGDHMKVGFYCKIWDDWGGNDLSRRELKNLLCRVLIAKEDALYFTGSTEWLWLATRQYRNQF
jgi:hypothetical protein